MAELDAHEAVGRYVGLQFRKSQLWERVGMEGSPDLCQRAVSKCRWSGILVAAEKRRAINVYDVLLRAALLHLLQ
eukprot:7363045-Pyramimonas_sp.AAC.1